MLFCLTFFTYVMSVLHTRNMTIFCYRFYFFTSKLLVDMMLLPTLHNEYLIKYISTSIYQSPCSSRSLTFFYDERDAFYDTLPPCLANLLRYISILLMPAYNICRGKEMHELLCLRRDAACIAEHSRFRCTKRAS